MVEHAPNKTILVKGCERLPRKLFCSQPRIAESAWKRTGTPIPAGPLMIEGNSKIRHASTKQVVENSCTSLLVSRVFPLQDCTFQAGVRVRGSFVKLGMLWQLEHRDFCISVSPFLPSFARSPKKAWDNSHFTKIDALPKNLNQSLLHPVYLLYRNLIGAPKPIAFLLKLILSCGIWEVTTFEIPKKRDIIRDV